jgi:hypothetical protein
VRIDRAFPKSTRQRKRVKDLKQNVPRYEDKSDSFPHREAHEPIVMQNSQMFNSAINLTKDDITRTYDRYRVCKVRILAQKVKGCQMGKSRCSNFASIGFARTI